MYEAWKNVAANFIRLLNLYGLTHSRMQSSKDVLEYTGNPGIVKPKQTSCPLSFFQE